MDSKDDIVVVKLDLKSKNKNDYICEFSTETKDLDNLVGNVTNLITDIC